MNILELDALIASLDEVKDAGLIAFYLEQRKKLLKQINEELSKKITWSTRLN